MHSKTVGILLLLTLGITLSHSSIPEVQPVRVALGTVVLEEVAQQFNLFRLTTTFGAAAFDANGDGWTDLLISNHGGRPSIYINNGGTGFKREENQLLRVPGSDRHAPAVADFDNDGDEDFYFQHGAHSGTGLGPKELFINVGKNQPFQKANNVMLADAKGRGRTAIWFDYDADGLLDLYLANTFRADAPNRLFRNLGNGNFEDVSAATHLDLHLDTFSGTVIAGDIDNDGDMDLFLCGSDRPYLLINTGAGVFQDETAERGIPLVPDTWSASMADYNDDGFLDLYISRGVELTLEGAGLDAHRLNFMQEVSSPTDRTDLLTFHADPNADLSFTFYKTIFTSFVDINNIYIGGQGKNPRRAKFVVGRPPFVPSGVPPQWKPDGSQKGTFIWRDDQTGLWTIAAASGNDEKFHSGAIVTTTSNLTRLQMFGMERPQLPKFPNILLENHNGIFTDVTGVKKVPDPSNSRSSVWADLDNDGDLDLLVINAGFNGFGKQPNTFYLNQHGSFHQYRVPMVRGENFGRGDGAVTADFNRDGLLDLFIVNGSGPLPNSKGPYELFLNRSDSRNAWIDFVLVGAGKNYTNRDAVGAKVEIQRSGGGSHSWQYILGGSGSNAQSSRTIHFGLGSAGSITARVHWPPSKTYPNGHIKTLHFLRDQFNQTYMIHEL